MGGVEGGTGADPDVEGGRESEQPIICPKLGTKIADLLTATTTTIIKI